MKYKIIRTETADNQIRSIILYIAEQFGTDVALEKLNELEEQINILGTNPYIGKAPNYAVLRRQGYKILMLKKNILFYKINEERHEIIVYAIFDHRQDYINIIQGL